MFGLTRGANKNHIVRAALESIAYQTKDILDAMKADVGKELSELRADGGASANNFLMQFQADILDKKVLCPDTTEATALGAAYLAGLATGVWTNTDELSSHRRKERWFYPNMSADQREKLLGGWHNAVQRSLAGAG
jgi:glycerol kinase